MINLKSYRLPPWLAVVALVVLGLMLRLLALLWIDVIGGDSASRIQIAADWLRNPRFITHGYWGPLHFYLLAAVLKVSGGDWRIAPILLNIVLSVATVPFFYGLVRLMFERRFAVLTTLAFTLYPVSFQNSLTALSETLFVFLVVGALYFVARVRLSLCGRHACYAGIFLTLASMVRYEGWVLGVLLVPLVPGIRRKFLFLCCSLIHPLYWMYTSLHYYGDPFYGFNFTKQYVIETMGFNESVTLSRKILRALSFPLLLFMGLTPPIFLLCLAGVLRCALRGLPSRLWLFPLTGLAGLFVLRSFSGESVPRPSYSILIAVFLLPMLAGGALLLQQRLKRRVVESILCVLILLMMPLAYVPYQSLPVVGKLINQSVPVSRSVRPIPKVTGRYETYYRTVLPIIQAHIRDQPEALIVDFIGWDATALLPLSLDLPNSRLLVVHGGPRIAVTAEHISAFVSYNPKGLLLLKAGSPFSDLFRRAGDEFLFDGGKAMKVQEVVRILDVCLYQYDLSLDHR